MVNTGSLSGQGKVFKVVLVSLYLIFSSVQVRASWTPEQLSGSNAAIKFVFNTYVRALSILPNWASYPIQKTVGIFVQDVNGNSAWAVYNATATPNLPCGGGYSMTPLIYGEVENASCNLTGPCNKISYTKGHNYLPEPVYSISDTKYINGAGCYLVEDNPIVNLPRYSDICYQTGWNATGYHISSCYEVDYSTWSFYSNTYWYTVSGSPGAGYLGEGTILLQLPPAYINNIKEVRDTLQAAYNFQQSENVSFPNPDTDDEAVAIQIIDNGITISTGIPPGFAEPPWIYYPSTPTVTIDLSGVESRLDTANSYLRAISTSSGGGVDLSSTNAILNNIYGFISSTATPNIDTSTLMGQFSSFVSSITTNFTATLQDLIIPNSTDTWRPCFSFDFSSVEIQGHALSSSEFCLDSIPNWNNFMILFRVLLNIGVLIWGIFWIWSGGMS